MHLTNCQNIEVKQKNVLYIVANIFTFVPSKKISLEDLLFDSQ